MKPLAMKSLVSASLLILVLVITGCAAVHTSVAKRNLDVQTQMTSTIFLDPVEPEQRTIFVDIRNTSDKPEFNLRDEVVAALEGRGYRVIDSPGAAHYWLQANVLQVGRTNAREANAAMYAGYGAAGGAVAGYALHRATGGAAGAAAAGAALAGAVVGTAFDALVEDVYYSVITDIQIMERFNGVVRESSEHQLLQGNSGDTISRYSRETDQRRYQSRVISYANQANLKWEEAAPELRRGMVRALSGLF
jgi:hypothetical protein